MPKYRHENNDKYETENQNNGISNGISIKTETYKKGRQYRH